MSETIFLAFLENLEIAATCAVCGIPSFQVFGGQPCPHHCSIACSFHGDDGSIQKLFAAANEMD